MDGSGVVLLRDPQRNMDSAFEKDERKKLGIRGLLPPAIIPIDVLQKRTMMQFEKLGTPLEKYVFLMALQVFTKIALPRCFQLIRWCRIETKVFFIASLSTTSRL